MNRLAALLYIALALTITGSSVSTPAAAPRPNFVLLLSDDQTFSALGAMGNPQVRTPHLDRLAENGTLFTHAYNMGGWNGAICIASRAMLNSGRSIWQARSHSQQWANQDRTAYRESWARLMQRNGYRTYMSGKWHVAAPAEEIFQITAHVRPGMPPDAWADRYKESNETPTGQHAPTTTAPPGYNRPQSQNDTSWSPSDTTLGGYWQGGTHWSEVIRQDAEQFIASTDERPFFMYLAFNAPHDPRQAAARFQRMYPVEDIHLPAAYRTEHPDMVAMGAGPHLRDEALAPFPRTPLAVRTHLSEYYAIITHLDEQIGLILDALAASGQADNTYIIFTSDHGLSVGNHGLMGKQSMYDHSIRVPFIIAGPTIPAGRQIATDIYLQDAMATALDIAGIERPDYLYFHSVLPLLEGRQGYYPAIYGMYTDRQRMIRKDDYKLIVLPTVRKRELYDLKSDPFETTNLAGTQEHRQLEYDLFTDLQRLQKSMGDTLDISASRPNKP